MTGILPRLRAIALLGALLAEGSGPVLAGGPVTVADEAPPAVAIDLPDWQGFYLGLSLAKPTGENVFGRSDLDIWSRPSDWTGSLSSYKAGYDWQRGRMVFGVAMDVYSSDISNPPINGEFVACFGECKIAVSELKMLRGRVGVASGKNLFYVTAGMARAFTRFTALGFAVVGEGEVDGWTAGIGIERRVTNHLTVTGEYRHIDLGALPLPCFSTCQTPIRFGLAELGVVYRW